MQQAVKYIEDVHGRSQGYITRAFIVDKNYSQWHYKFKNLKNQEFEGKHNTYISLNTFYKPQRRIENIKELNALYLDLDIYNIPKIIDPYLGYTSNWSKDSVLYFLEEDYFELSSNGVPTPSLVIDSGRGLYLIWLIEPAPYKALPLWKAIEEYLYNQLKCWGADRKCLDPTRILRVPGSINSKTNTSVKIIREYNTDCYSLRFIQENYLPELIPKEKKKGRPKKVVSIYRERSLYIERIHDLIKLCELRNYDLRGERECLLFLYRYYTCYFSDDPVEALNNIIDLNNKFVYPLKKREVTNATKSAETAYKTGKVYKYKNETLIDMLHITREEQKKLNTIIDNVEYQRRKTIRDANYYKTNKEEIKQKYKTNKEEIRQKYESNKEEIRQKYVDKLHSKGKLLKSEQIYMLRNAIIQLKKDNYKNSDISSTLGIPTKTLERHITFLRKQNLM